MFMNCTPKVRQKTFGVQFVYEKDIHRETQNSTRNRLWVPQRRLRVQYHLGQHYLENLIDRYRKYGEGGLYSKAQKKIPSDFKVKLVRDFIEKGVSLRHICNENEISRTAFESWVRKARSHGYDSLRAIKRRGRPPKDMARPKKREPQTELEKLQAENLRRLRAENALLKKVKALVEEQEARARLNGQKPSTN